MISQSTEYLKKVLSIQIHIDMGVKNTIPKLLKIKKVNGE